MTEPESRAATLTSEWLINHIREHGGVMTVVRDVVIDWWTVYQGPSGRMGAPDQPDDFVRLQAEDLTIYLARNIWEQIKPGRSKLLLGVSGYGRFWLHLAPR